MREKCLPRSGSAASRCAARGLGASCPRLQDAAHPARRFQRKYAPALDLLRGAWLVPARGPHCGGSVLHDRNCASISLVGCPRGGGLGRDVRGAAPRHLARARCMAEARTKLRAGVRTGLIFTISLSCRPALRGVRLHSRALVVRCGVCVRSALYGHVAALLHELMGMHGACRASARRSASPLAGFPTARCWYPARGAVAGGAGRLVAQVTKEDASFKRPST